MEYRFNTASGKSLHATYMLSINICICHSFNTASGKSLHATRMAGVSSGNNQVSIPQAVRACMQQMIDLYAERMGLRFQYRKR